MHAFQANILTQQARCNMKRNNVGWTVILRKKLISHNMIKWISHVLGMILCIHAWIWRSKYWIWYGLHNINCFTSREQVDLQIVLKFAYGSTHFWTYNHFVTWLIMMDQKESTFFTMDKELILLMVKITTMEHLLLRLHMIKTMMDSPKIINCSDLLYA